MTKERGNMTKEQEARIREIALMYNIDLSGKIPPKNSTIKRAFEKGKISLDTLHLKRFEFFLVSIIPVDKDKNINKALYDFAKFIELLKKSHTNKFAVTISSKKGSKKQSVTIDNQESIMHLWRFANIILDHLQDGMYEFMPKSDYTLDDNGDYEREFDWYEKKKRQEETYDTDYPSMYWGSIMPFTDAELKEIINFEASTIREIESNPKDRNASVLRLLIKLYQEDGVFDNSKKTIKTNEACFLYDCLSLFEIMDVDETLSKQEKYQRIKAYLNKK